MRRTPQLHDRIRAAGAATAPGATASGADKALELSGLPHLAELLAAGIPDRETAFSTGLRLITAGVIAK